MQFTRLFPGIILAVILAITARQLAQLPMLSILGAMIIAIFLGIALRAPAALPMGQFQPGVGFTAKYLLRLGIILMGLRLDLSDIVAAGWQTMALDLFSVVFTISVIHILGRKYTVDRKLTTLLAVGTGVCGAAAIGAVAPLIKAKDEDVAVSVAIIALLGTVFSVAYIMLLPVLGLDAQDFGTFAGATLHELAHVIAAAEPDGPISGETAILVKLGRVALLTPVAMYIGWLYTRGKQQETAAGAPIPWFLFGFLGMALVNTLHILPQQLSGQLITASAFLITMAMAAMGLNVNLVSFLRVGHHPVLICLIGSLLLSLTGLLLVRVIFQ